jgi:hypothetical protein
VAIRTLRSTRSSISDTDVSPQFPSTLKAQCLAPVRLLTPRRVFSCPVMFGLAVVSAFSMVVRFHHSPSLHPDIFMYPISSLSIYLHTHITHKPSPCRTIYKSFCFPENWSLCFPFAFVLEVVAIYSFHTCPLVSPLALSLSLHRHYTYALTFLSFLYILYC